MNASPSKLLALLAGALMLAAPAFAGKTDMQTLNVAPSKKTETPSKADYKALENAGLYSSASEGSLGKDLWKGIKRSDLTALLSDMPVESKEPAVQRLIFGALLSQTDSTMIDNDVPIEPGNDIFTLRLEKLIQAGAYKQAQDLYSSFDELEPYHERLLRAGILAMMLNGEQSLACVEAETSKDNFSESEFLKQILAYCDIALSDAPSPESRGILETLKLSNLDLITSKDAVMTYNPKSFSALPLIERAFLAAGKKIDFAKSGITNINDIPPTDIRILLGNDNLSEKDAFFLTAAAEQWGLAMPGEMLALYKAALPPAGGDPSTLQVPATSEAWEKIGLYHVIAANAEDNEAEWNAIKNAFAAGNQYGIAALKPYAELVAEVQPTDATDAELETGLELLNAAGKPIPQQWVERIRQIAPEDGKSELNQRVYAMQAAVEISKNKGKKAPQDAEKAAKTPYPPGSRSGYLLKNIIENVDKAGTNSDNAGRIYEKDYGLTFRQDYVMPSTVVWNHLLDAGQRGNTAETVLLSASVLQAENLGVIYPGLLNDVLAGLNNVGLTDISTNLAIAAVLGSIQAN